MAFHITIGDAENRANLLPAVTTAMGSRAIAIDGDTAKCDRIRPPAIASTHSPSGRAIPSTLHSSLTATELPTMTLENVAWDLITFGDDVPRGILYRSNVS
jgi:hypothetical protein